ncbi:hypothetical protein MRX96_055459 [Rhipicephalus microplus]
MKATARLPTPPTAQNRFYTTRGIGVSSNKSPGSVRTNESKTNAIARTKYQGDIGGGRRVYAQTARARASTPWDPGLAGRCRSTNGGSPLGKAENSSDWSVGEGEEVAGAIQKGNRAQKKGAHPENRDEGRVSCRLKHRAAFQLIL